MEASDPSWNAIKPQYVDKLDPTFVSWYNKYNVGKLATHEVAIEEYRADPLKYAIAWGRSIGREVGAVTDHKVSVQGGEIIVRQFEPKTSARNRPCYINFHGGGWVFGGLAVDDSFNRLVVDELGCVVFDVDYRLVNFQLVSVSDLHRLAPEHPYPIPVDDCLAAFKFVVAHATEFDVDKTKIAVGGCSAGGHLAAVISILARDERIPLRLQLLGVPCIDSTHVDPSGQLSKNCPYPSWRDNAEAPCLPLDRMSYFYNHFLGNPRPVNYKNVIIFPSSGFPGKLTI